MFYMVKKGVISLIPDLKTLAVLVIKFRHVQNLFESERLTRSDCAISIVTELTL